MTSIQFEPTFHCVRCLFHFSVLSFASADKDFIKRQIFLANRWTQPGPRGSERLFERSVRFSECTEKNKGIFAPSSLKKAQNLFQQRQRPSNHLRPVSLLQQRMSHRCNRQQKSVFEPNVSANAANTTVAFPSNLHS